MRDEEISCSNHQKSHIIILYYKVSISSTCFTLGILVNILCKVCVPSIDRVSRSTCNKKNACSHGVLRSRQGIKWAGHQVSRASSDRLHSLLQGSTHISSTSNRRSSTSRRQIYILVSSMHQNRVYKHTNRQRKNYK